MLHKPLFTDTHCHLYSKQFDIDRAEMLQRAIEIGVTKFFLPNIDAESLPRLYDMWQQFQDCCFPMMGLHPCSVNDDYKNQLKWVEACLSGNHPAFAFHKFYAIGEIGLDYYWDKTHIVQQQEVFRQQIRWAKTLKLPIAVHARNSMDDILKIIEEEQDGTLTGVLHCFTGTMQQALRGIALNFYLGIGGVVTFKNASVDKIVEQIEVKHLVLETDAPYLAPVPYRGKRNESAYITLIAEKISTLKNIPLSEVAAITTQNATALFKMA
jgi:TatD DNase family protein